MLGPRGPWPQGHISCRFGHAAEQTPRASSDQEHVAVVVLLGHQVAGREVADERQVPHVVLPPDRGRRLGQREDGPQRPGEAFGVAVEPLVQRG